MELQTSTARTVKEISMTTLAELARLIRSKNAGPFELTFDIMFDDAATLRTRQASGAVSREAVAARYGLPASEVQILLLRQCLRDQGVDSAPPSRAICSTATAMAASNMRR